MTGSELIVDGGYAAQSGYFLVYDAPGSYIMVPEEPIGLGQQAPAVLVGTEGLTYVDFTFDAGIR